MLIRIHTWAVVAVMKFSSYRNRLKATWSVIIGLEITKIPLRVDSSIGCKEWDVEENKFR
jgi:hypothetical protein